MQADVDLVSIMGRTGFLPCKSQQPRAASLVSQGGSQVGQVGPAGGQPASDGALQNTDTPKGGWQANSASSPKAAAAVTMVSINIKPICYSPTANDVQRSTCVINVSNP